LGVPISFSGGEGIFSFCVGFEENFRKAFFRRSGTTYIREIGTIPKLHENGCIFDRRFRRIISNDQTGKREGYANVLRFSSGDCAALRR